MLEDLQLDRGYLFGESKFEIRVFSVNLTLRG